MIIRINPWNEEKEVISFCGTPYHYSEKWEPHAFSVIARPRSLNTSQSNSPGNLVEDLDILGRSIIWRDAGLPSARD
jgi:hypothetical protein